jgi:dethiobiotin synthetase
MVASCEAEASMTEVLIVTGTDTGVGKTITTAALAARALNDGRTVAVLKPAQTGTAAFEPGETSDVDTVIRLAGTQVTCMTLAEYPDPLAPLAAAQVAGLPQLYLADVLEAVEYLGERNDLVLVEGAGGLLVPMGYDGWTIADAAVALRAPAVVVARAGLGTLNHTALTLEALRSRGIAASVVIGSWPAVPELVHHRNRTDLPGTVVGVIPEGAGLLSRSEFGANANSWFS